MIEQGEIYWMDGPIDAETGNGIAHPHVVIQDTAINASRIDLIAVCAISTNMNRAFDLGNILLHIGEGGLEKTSFVAVGLVSLVSKDRFTRRLGKLSASRVQEILSGVMQRASSVANSDHPPA